MNGKGRGDASEQNHGGNDIRYREFHSCPRVEEEKGRWDGGKRTQILSAFIEFRVLSGRSNWGYSPVKEKRV
jgi:hypothetical protein